MCKRNNPSLQAKSLQISASVACSDKYLPFPKRGEGRTPILKSISELWIGMNPAALPVVIIHLWLLLFPYAPGPQWCGVQLLCCTGMCWPATLDNRDTSLENRLQDHREHQGTSASRSLIRKQRFHGYVGLCLWHLTYHIIQNSLIKHINTTPLTEWDYHHNIYFCLFIEVLPSSSKFLKVTTTTGRKHSSGSKWVKENTTRKKSLHTGSGKPLVFHI